MGCTFYQHLKETAKEGHTCGYFDKALPLEHDDIYIHIFEYNNNFVFIFVVT